MPVQPDHPLLKENRKPKNKKPFWSEIHLAAGGLVFAGGARVIIAAGLISDYFGRDSEEGENYAVLASGFLTASAFLLGWWLTKKIFAILEEKIQSARIMKLIKIIWTVCVIVIAALINFLIGKIT